MSKYRCPFCSVAELDKLLSSYFKEQALPEQTEKNLQKELSPPTMSGLAYHLGFESIEAFEACETNRRYASRLKRARLRVEAEYEKKLHFQSSAGAIFALKSLGWEDRRNNIKNGAPEDNNLKIEIVNSGPSIAGEEKDVVL